MLCTLCCPPTILGGFYRIPEKSPKSFTDKMNRACELKDQTLKKIRTGHCPDHWTSKKCTSRLSANYLGNNCVWGQCYPRRGYKVSTIGDGVFEWRPLCKFPQHSRFWFNLRKKKKPIPKHSFPRRTAKGVQNVLFPQGGANRTANSPWKGPKPEEIISEGCHLK